MLLENKLESVFWSLAHKDFAKKIRKIDQAQSIFKL